MKGEEKSRIQKQCFYGPDGKVQKQQLTAPPPPEEAAPGGLKGKIVAKKKAEISAVMKQAVALVQSYVPPDPQRIQATKAAGNLAMSPTGPDSIRLDLRNYVKSGDTLSLGLDTARYALQTVSVKSYLESKEDAVTLDVTFARLRDGLSYPGNVVLNVPGQNIQVVVQNSGYQRVTPAPAGAEAGGWGRQARSRAGAGEAECVGRGPRHPDRAHRAVPGCPGRADPGGVEGRRRRAEVRRLAEERTAPSRAPSSRTPRRRPGSRPPTSRWRRFPRWSR